jgi:hypothetical protein
VVKVLNRAASAMVLYGMVQLLLQMIRKLLINGRTSDNGKHLLKKLKNGNHVLMLTLEEIHGQIRKNNAGAKTNQLINHGNVLMKEMNASVTAVGLSMVLNLMPIRKNSISSELLNYHWLLLAPRERRALTVMPLLSMELTQLQMPIKSASATQKRNSSIRVSSEPPRLSGSHLNLRNNPKVSSREPPNTLQK